MPFFFVDYWYLVLVVPAVLVSLWAQIKVKSTFSKYSGYAVRCGMTGAGASRYILQVNGVYTLTDDGKIVQKAAPYALEDQSHWGIMSSNGVKNLFFNKCEINRLYRLRIQCNA